MTPIVCCGMECGVLGNLSHWNAFSGAGTAVYDTAIVRSGSRSLKCSTVGQTIQLAGQGTLSDRRVGRIYIWFETLPSANTGLVRQNTSAGPQILFKQSDSKLYAAVGTTLGSTGVSVTTGQWYRLDYDFNVVNAANDTCDLQVDGTACGQATAAGDNAGSVGDTIGILDTCTADLRFEDYMASNTAADFPIGAGNVYHFIPTSDGTHNVAGANDFERSATGTDITNATTTAFQLIDDVPMKSGTVSEYINLIAPPNATDYVEVVYGPASGISTPTVAPRAVDAIMAYASSATGTFNIQLALNDNGTTNNVINTNTAPGMSATYGRKQYATAPTGGAWTVSAGAGNFNNIRARCLTSDAAPDPWWASAMIEAEFAPPAAVTSHNTRSNPLGTEIGMGWRMPI